MRRFAHFNAASIDEAVALLERFGKKAAVIAGGTDLLGKLKDEVLPGYPEALINIKTIAGLDFIREQESGLALGALTRLEDIARHEGIKSRYGALALAAQRTASPHIREMGTLGGNLCQDIRCWYYRNPGNRFPCLRKGGGRCYAIEGENRYHSIFGGSVEQGCYAVHPSDIAPALIALDGRIETNARVVKAEEFFDVDVAKTTVLEDNEIVTQIHIPAPSGESRSSFIKFAARKTIDFPIVNCAAMVRLSSGKVSDARVCLNAVYVKPYRAREAEDAVIGRTLDEQGAQAAGEVSTADARPMANNGYMVQIAKTLVKRALLDCLGDGAQKEGG